MLVFKNECRYLSIEMLLQNEIFEEYDQMVDNRARQKPPARQLKKKGRSDDQFNNEIDLFGAAAQNQILLILEASKKVSIPLLN